MMRNTKNIEGGTLFVTKKPRDECTPLLEMQGIKTVVLSKDLEEGQKQGISYIKFPDRVNNRKFNCLCMKWNEHDVKRKLKYESENVEKAETMLKIRKTENS